MEAADSTTNSSKVIVQCHGPNDLFDKVVSSLEPRLPLNKLHWKSPNRPLRSIDQLNVSFVREDSKSDVAATARRHQIPGLRQTPAVKVYLLRCDDRETYKETCRKDVKQWLKAQGISQDGKTLMKGQERHDAYEYIILHVVLPGTTAATQPKSAKHISLENYDSTDSVNSKSKWTGKSPSTVYDKLRADFSSSSKAPFERVAQVRISDPENKQGAGLSPSDLEELWQDFVEKLKTAILLSFDARVTQYEEDIRDREAQRRLPGWNFCTFFVLKEGLARGFENVGLVEDALTIYDELDAGLDTLVQDQASREEPDPTGALLPFSNDLKPAIRSALEGSYDVSDSNETITTNADLQELISIAKPNFPFDVESKNYQQRILTNQASALDFHIYIFTRQLQLLFRQAKLATLTNRPAKPTSPSPNTDYDLSILAEICEKSTSFITFVGRALRGDLYAAWGGQEGLDDDELKTQKLVIGGLVVSWKWSAIMQILADCRILSFLSPIFDSSNSLEEVANQTTMARHGAVDNNASPVDEDLSLWVGELILMARDLVREIIVLLDDQDLRGDSARGLQSHSLNQLFRSRETAKHVLQLLTIDAYQCFKNANRDNACHRMLHALAEIEIERDNIGRAIWWLEHIPDLSNLQARTATDRTLLNLYAKCLKSHEQFEKYIQTLTSLLLSAVVSPVARALPQYDQWTQQILNELVSMSDSVDEIGLPLGSFISVQDIPTCISHDTRGFGFSLSISLSLRFNASIDVSEVELEIRPPDGQDRPIVLNTSAPFGLNSSKSRAQLYSTVTTEGWYDLSRLTLRMGKLILVHQFQAPGADRESRQTDSSTKPWPILVYPSSTSFRVNARASSIVDLTEPGRLLLEIHFGSNEVEQCTIFVRPATAGVRLDIRAAQCYDSETEKDMEIVHQADSTGVLLRELSSEATRLLEIPYSLENLTPSLSLRVSAECKTSNGDFTVSLQRLVNINLPISINVQDIFQAQKSFSRFTATPSTAIPLRLLNWDVRSNNTFEISQCQLAQEPINVFPKLPASWVVETMNQDSASDKQDKLPVTVQYQSYEDLILNSVELQFRQDIKVGLVSPATELLVSHILAQIPFVWTEQDLEAAVLLQEFEMCSYEVLDWNNTLRALHAEERNRTEVWLRSWCDKRQRLDLSLAQARVRQVRLAVEMPRPSMIISSHIKLSPASRQHFAVGEPVLAVMDIEIAHSREKGVEVHFEVTSHLDTWLIGGKKRGTLEPDAEHTTASIILIALKPGHLLLPNIEIKSRRIGDSGDTGHVAAEIENRSQTTSVLVMPNLHATTIALGVDGLAGRYWPVESRRRSDTL